MLKRFKIKMNLWAKSHFLQLIIFNILLVFLFLLRSAGYFHPFFVISVNAIVLIGLIASIFLLGVKSKAMFLVALLFWLFAGFVKLIKIDVWAERTAVYAYQALIIGVILLIVESVKLKK